MNKLLLVFIILFLGMSSSYAMIDLSRLSKNELVHFEKKMAHWITNPQFNFIHKELNSSSAVFFVEYGLINDERGILRGANGAFHANHTPEGKFVETKGGTIWLNLNKFDDAVFEEFFHAFQYDIYDVDYYFDDLCKKYGYLIEFEAKIARIYCDIFRGKSIPTFPCEFEVMNVIIRSGLDFGKDVEVNKEEMKLAEAYFYDCHCSQKKEMGFELSEMDCYTIPYGFHTDYRAVNLLFKNANKK